MEIIKSNTGNWWCPVFLGFKTSVKEDICLVRFGDLYVVLRITDCLDCSDEDDCIQIEKKHTKSYEEALGWYEEWNKLLVWHMTDT